LNQIKRIDFLNTSMRFSPSATIALFREPPADRLDIAAAAVLEAVSRQSMTVSAADVRMALLRFEASLGR
jgi:hypothetical protein